MTALAPAPESTRVPQHPRPRVTFPRLLRSEWIKVTSLRSTWWSLGIAAVLSIGISMLIASASRELGAGYPAVSAILSPTQFTMLVAGILGAIVVTGEYSTGMIRSTLTAQPRRGAVLAAKAVVVSLLMALTTAIVYAIAIVGTAPILTEGIDWSDARASIVPLALGVLAMVCFTLLGLGFGFIVRNGAGAIAITVGVLFVLPIVLTLFSLGGEAWRWVVDLTQYLPSNAAAAVSSPGNDDLLPHLLTLLGWVFVPLLLGWTVLRSRDA
ncbi:ABC transporter permease subunit [Microbacterium sp. CJ88]|uniref:ABC transporter permease subunit n=1 Tax=Microbacterium sp. CJ88 TaxID=3445672 RepID=UPI003F6602E2